MKTKRGREEEKELEKEGRMDKDLRLYIKHQKGSRMLLESYWPCHLGTQALLGVLDSIFMPSYRFMSPPYQNTTSSL